MMPPYVMFSIEDIRKANEKMMSGDYSIPEHNRIKLTEKQINDAWAIVKQRGNKRK